MLLIIGLGNPGQKYSDNRHNIGFMALNALKETWNFPDFKFDKKFNAQVSKGNRQKKNICLIKPQTFMNQSGKTVRAILKFYKLAPANILVIHDDIDLPLGKYKFAANSSSAGNNGVQNIIDTLGTQGFKRIRIGVANNDLRTRIDPGDFVLQDFSKEEKKEINKILKQVVTEKMEEFFH